MNFWQSLAKFILRNRILLLCIITASTLVMGYFASKVQITNEFNRSIPTDNPKYKEYLSFKKKFGEDGNVMVLGIENKNIYKLDNFKKFEQLAKDLKQNDAVEEVLCSATAINIFKDTSTKKFGTVPIFTNINTQPQLDSALATYLNLPFYKYLLYNPETHVELVAIKIKKDIMNTTKRSDVVHEIISKSEAYAKSQSDVTIHYSGLPLLRTQIAEKLRHESFFFTILSLVLTTLILLFFFRSIATTFYSLIVVIIGVIFTLGLVVLFGYKITLLTALVPTLIVVIGIPNCVYLVNKYHTEYNKHGDKMIALHNMIAKMGEVTLFTNLTAAVGFGVFIFTKSVVLKEFGLIAGLNILIIFVVSLIFIPTVFSFMPSPSDRHTDYLENKWLLNILGKLENWVENHRKTIYITTAVAFAISVIGVLQLKSFGYVIDDLPKDDKLYTDLKFFEKHFNGVLPFEILIDAKKKGRASTPQMFDKIDQLEQVLAQYSYFGKPLSIAQGVKFATQAYYNGDAEQYRIPQGFEQAFVYGALLKKGSNNNSKTNNLLSAFIDSSKQVARISINMHDVGSDILPKVIDSIQPQIDAIFDTSKYKVTITGTNVIFLEGSKFITHGLRDSLILAFITIVVCMFWLFRSWRLLLISLLPNILPLLITAGIMGFAGISLKPSTVLIFSVSLGIAIDVTIRFLINYKQELATHNYDIAKTVKNTIHETGISIIYTSLILFAGFFIFCLSGFGGTKVLGLLTSTTLILSMITNLTLLPGLLMWLDKWQKNKN